MHGWAKEQAEGAKAEYGDSCENIELGGDHKKRSQIWNCDNTSELNLSGYFSSDSHLRVSCCPNEYLAGSLDCPCPQVTPLFTHAEEEKNRKIYV